ncbi:hypothetical protein EKG37_14190 [Robertmurraya yapensis]|uniref:WYL domain-containing protein n=1 Tax=Bacillus yapensis TaxID=2492960 RepID=A0A3S0L999_9BACI|nr:hypothetical protein [Bacillus yapensis]RTR30044.1 hypothetical protein EKG37_14190 [Bacillus yapensis]TKS95125.1 WYL domain-containing protein [Bacillus yapensis]
MDRLLLRSLNEQIPVEMIYLSSTNQFTKRKIVVSHINDTTIRAYCYLRKQSRLFKIENILSVMVLKQFRNLG